MIKLGLTGSIGMGKSTTAKMFAEENIPVYDADRTVHELYLEEAVEPVRQVFPDAIVDNQVNREILGQIVLGDKARLKQLEQIVHPLVHKKEQQFLAHNQDNGAKLVLLDIPLLFETGGEARVDKIAVVSAGAEEQKRRVLVRDGMTEEKFNSILERQIPDAVKRQKADFVIDTGQGLEFARKQVQNIIAELTSDVSLEQAQ